MSKSNGIFNSIIWKFMETSATSIVHILITIILARLLLPEDYAIVGVISVFINLANVFVHSGLGSGLIQKSDAKQIDYTSVFYLQVLVSLILYLVLFFLAPFIANYYQMVELCIMMRVLSIWIIVSAINGIQLALLRKRMLFKFGFMVGFIEAIIKAIIGVSLALNNFGAWSLIYSQIAGSLMRAIILWTKIGWRPTFVFSFVRVKKIFVFSVNIMLVSFSDTLFNNIHTLIIGKVYDKETLGFYTQGNKIPQMASRIINTSIGDVAFPALSLKQDKLDELAMLVKRMISLSMFIVMPMMLGLAIVAEPLVYILLTEKWMQCVPILQCMAIFYMFLPVQTYNFQALKAIGDSKTFLLIDTAKKILVLLFLILSIRFGIMYMVIANLMANIIATIIYTIVAGNKISYPWKEQWNDILRPLAISLIMGVIVYFVSGIIVNIYVKLTVDIIIGCIVYGCLSYILNNKSFLSCIMLVKNKLESKPERMRCEK